LGGGQTTLEKRSGTAKCAILNRKVQTFSPQMSPASMFPRAPLWLSTGLQSISISNSSSNSCSSDGGLVNSPVLTANRRLFVSSDQLQTATVRRHPYEAPSHAPESATDRQSITQSINRLIIS